MLRPSRSARALASSLLSRGNARSPGRLYRRHAGPRGPRGTTQDDGSGARPPPCCCRGRAAAVRYRPFPRPWRRRREGHQGAPQTASNQVAQPGGGDRDANRANAARPSGSGDQDTLSPSAPRLGPAALWCTQGSRAPTSPQQGSGHPRQSTAASRHGRDPPPAGHRIRKGRGRATGASPLPRASGHLASPLAASRGGPAAPATARRRQPGWSKGHGRGARPTTPALWTASRISCGMLTRVTC